MHFRTQIPISKSDRPIDYGSKVVSVGSCFAVSMSEKFGYFKFQHTVNPFGVLFHPPAIEKLIGFAVSGKEFAEEDIFFLNGSWHCFDAHSDLNAISKDALLSGLNSAIGDFRRQLTASTHIIITLGTAWVYRCNANREIVANCHKVPQKEFTKELLSPETIVTSLQNIISGIHSLNPDSQVLFTVSPVRHIKDGLVENQWSKAHLVTAVHRSVLKKPSVAGYFPSYEIMMDELRDYRFYAEDMLHPNTTAIDYIWQRFSQNYIAASAIPVMEEVAAVQKGLSHRPFHPDTKQHADFLCQLQQRIAKLQLQFPHIVFQA